jgi:lipid-A-disaccharide synthase
MATPRLFLIAGEASGDRLGAALIRGLQQLEPQVEIRGIGGPMMAAEGMASLFPMAELAVMGLAEVLPRLRGLLGRKRETLAAIAAMGPDALITIDSPGFCLRVAEAARAARPGLRTIHYVAPSVWAWKPGRAAKMARYIDHVLALLPFEPRYMTGAGMSCDFVGHPVAGEPQATADEAKALRHAFGVDVGRKLLTILPGSRRSEVTRILPVMAGVIRNLRQRDPELTVLLPAAPGLAGLISGMLAELGVVAHLLRPETLPVAEAEARKRAAYAASDAALAASGTVSLELAAQNTPMVIAWRANWLTETAFQRLALIDTPTLVNLVSETRVVPDFLFRNCTAGAITPAVAALLAGGGARQRDVFPGVMAALGRGGEEPGLRAARSALARIAPK